MKRILILLFLILFISGCNYKPITPNQEITDNPTNENIYERVDITSSECASKDGEIVNANVCPDGKYYLGNVIDINCICICCSNNPGCMSPCPQLMPLSPDFCKDGIIVPGDVNSCGCQMPPTCESESKITINDQESDFLVKSCGVSGTEGGQVIYSLSIVFNDNSQSNFNTISFSIQDLENNKDNLLTLGTHQATGNHWDKIEHMLQPSTFTRNYIEGDQMEIVWEKMDISDYKFNGEGYINIKQKIEWECPEQVWVGGHYAIKSNSDYICNYEDYYIPTQKIYFKCQDGTKI